LTVGIFDRIGVSATDVQALSAIASVLLTIVLVWATLRYARDTRRMVDETRRQHRPYLYLLYQHDSSATDAPTVYRLMLKNAGDRVAQDATIRVLQDAPIVEYQQDKNVKNEVLWKAVVVPVSSVQVFREGVKSLGPGDVLYLGFSQWYRSAVEHQTLVYQLEYLDGAGVKYDERLTLGYWICRPPYPN